MRWWWAVLLCCLIPAYSRPRPPVSPPLRIYRCQLLGGVLPLRREIGWAELRDGDLVMVEGDAGHLYRAEPQLLEDGWRLRRLEAGRPGR